MRQSSSSHKPFIVPIFLPNTGCPHRCVFCDQEAITGHGRAVPSAAGLGNTIRSHLKYRGHRRNTSQISFYGGNFLGLRPADIVSLLEEASRFVDEGHIDSLRFSTRPDTISPGKLDLIEPYPVSTIELGVQSMDNRVLDRARRGHTAFDTQRAVGLVKARGYAMGLQMMVGLPGDNDEGALETARRIAALSPDFVRIYPTLVLAGSRLAEWYKRGDYLPMSLEASVSLVKRIYRLFDRRQIRVIRMGLQASPTLDAPTTVLAGPYHPAFGHLVLSELLLDRVVSALGSSETRRGRIALKVHPENVSRVRGLRNSNIDALKKSFHLHTLNITPDSTLGKDDLVIADL